MLNSTLLEIRRPSNYPSKIDAREIHIIRAYTFDTSCADVLLLGQSTVSTKGRHTLCDFTCRVVFEDPTVEMPKMKLLQIWPVGFAFPPLACL